MRFRAKSAAMPVKGATGRIYYFDPREPTTITDGRDIEFFLKHADVVNMDATLVVKGPEPVQATEDEPPKAAVTNAVETAKAKKEAAKEEPKAEEPKEEAPEEEAPDETKDEEEAEEKPPTVISTGKKKKRGRRDSSR
jgi:outer membrane biosynthesis protein TonB